MKLDIICAGSYAVSEIYNGLIAAVKQSIHVLDNNNPEITIMIRGVNVPVPRRPNALLLTDEPYEVNRTCKISPRYDLVFTNEHSTLGRHPRALYLPMACSSEIKKRSDDKLYDICHIGGGYPGRRDFIIPVMRHFRNTVLIGHGWPKISMNQSVSVDFKKHLDYYAKSKIVLNIHRNNIYSAFGRLNTQGHPVTHLAPRVWNAAAVGTMQIIDSQRDNALIPSLEKAVTPRELITKCEHYLARKDERATLEQKQHDEAIDHTWADRLGYILYAAQERGLIS